MGGSPFIVEKTALTKNGFMLTFSLPIDPKSLSPKVSSHRYHYHKQYGSKKIDVKNEERLKIKQIGPNQVVISLSNIERNKLYTIELAGLKSKDQKPLLGDVVRYNVVEVIN